MLSGSWRQNLRKVDSRQLAKILRVTKGRKIAAPPPASRTVSIL